MANLQFDKRSTFSVEETDETKTFWKIESPNVISWIHLGGTAKKKIFFRNKTFLFFKIER